MSPEDHAHDLAREIVGNHKKFDSFAWHIDWPEDFDQKWAVVYTSNRDSGLLTKSNEDAIFSRLKPYMGIWQDGDTVEKVGCNHWAVGYVDGFAIRVYDGQGEITPAFREYSEIHCALENYPVLDEEDFCRREYEALRESAEQTIGDVSRHENLYGFLPDSGEVVTWLYENEPSEVESHGDHGASPSRESVLEALLSLGMWHEDDCDSPRGDAPVVVNAESFAAKDELFGDYLE